MSRQQVTEHRGRGEPAVDHSATYQAWPAGRRRVVSIVIALHVMCVFIAPLAVVEPRSDLAFQTHRFLAPWTQLLYMDHGYRFFAPEPGPSHILEYTVGFDDGKTATFRFPDPQRHWPRLLYHRWFMLSESLYRHALQVLDEASLQRWTEEVESQIQQFADAGRMRDAARVSREFELARREHDRMRRLLSLLVSDIGRELLKRHEGSSLNMRLLTRLIPQPGEVQRGSRLDSPDWLPEDMVIELTPMLQDVGEKELIEPRERGREGERP